MPSAPHLIPYQGSKRRLAPAILSLCGEARFSRFYEPFAGSAALTIAAASARIASRYVFGDSLAALAGIWQLCVEDPDALAQQYETHWRTQTDDPRAYYLAARNRFNSERLDGDGDPATLLYLLARCVKNAPRFARDGSFNQAADHRRLGRSPDKVRAAAIAISALLFGRSDVVRGDFAASCARAGADDLVYLDPPWLGTTHGPDKRYHEGLAEARLVEVLAAMNERGVPWILSYDGRTGDKRYGRPLPARLAALHVEIDAGASSQATLSGRRATTFESLYVSSGLETTALQAVGRRPELALVANGSA